MGSSARKKERIVRDKEIMDEGDRKTGGGL